MATSPDAHAAPAPRATPASAGAASGVPGDATHAVLAALSAAGRAITLGASLDRVLTELAEGARDLVDARYAAIGIPEPEGDEFARFVTVGMSDELVARLGPLPRTHGLLDAMLVDPSPYRTADITQDPRFRGWWPSAHPLMRSFLGVPIVSAGDVDRRLLPHRQALGAGVLGGATRPRSCCWPRTRPSPSTRPGCSRTAASSP